MSFELINEAITTLFSWPTYLYIIFGVLLGIFVGALPGVGSTLGMAIVLPLTAPMQGLHAILFLVSIYSGATYGGATTAILLNVPGHSSSAASTFEGYPMSKNGEAKTALGLSATASAFGGLIGILTLLVISPYLILLLLMIGSPEYALVAILGLSMIAAVTKTSIVKGITIGMWGMLIATIGMAIGYPQERFTFGHLALFDGVYFVAVLIGIFAIAEMIKLSKREGGVAGTNVEILGSVKQGFMEVWKKPVTFIKSAYIGIGIGAIPGSGSSVSNFIAYTEAVRSNPDEEFGVGNPKGLIASETSNNALIGGALIPTLSFGIPGGGATAVLLGGLIMHGVQPGIDMFTTNLDFTYALYIGLILGNAVIFIMGMLLISKASAITTLDSSMLVPVIIPLAVHGALTLRNNWIDLLTVFLFGLIGFIMVKHNYSIIALILGVILGPIAEENFLRSLQLSDGSLLIFVSRPTSAIIVLAIFLIILSPIIQDRLSSDKN